MKNMTKPEKTKVELAIKRVLEDDPRFKVEFRWAKTLSDEDALYLIFWKKDGEDAAAIPV